MGYRATVITQHREYGSQTFCDWEKFVDVFVPKMEEAGFPVSDNDSQDFFEIEKEKLQEFVNTLLDNDEPSISEEHTNKELKEDLQRAINEAVQDK